MSSESTGLYQHLHGGLADFSRKVDTYNPRGRIHRGMLVGKLRWGFDLQDELLGDMEALVYPEDQWCDFQEACEEV